MIRETSMSQAVPNKSLLIGETAQPIRKAALDLSIICFPNHSGQYLRKTARCGGGRSVISATQEVEVGGSGSEASPMQKRQNPVKNKLKAKGLKVWLK
jgi:hypothetical protein